MSIGIGATTSTVKVKANARGLDAIQSVYAFAVALGLASVYIASQSFLTRILAGTMFLSDEKTIVVLLLFANVAMLSLRFFWVPRNLRSLVVTAARANAISPESRREPDDLSNTIIAYHLLIIFLHGALLYLVCAEFNFVVFLLSSNAPMSASMFFGYVMLHSALLLLNAGWIAQVRRQELRFENRFNPDGADNPRPSAGNVWWRNNLVASLIALSPFALSSNCSSSGLECVSHLPERATAALVPIFSTSPQVVATIYYDIAAVLNIVGISSAHAAVYWVMLVFLANSFYDLLNAGRFYVLFDDVEWESSTRSSQGSSPLEK